MSNALAVQDAKPTPLDIKKRYATLGKNSTADGGGRRAFMSFSGKTGGYAYGAEKDEMELGTTMAVFAESYRRGWICWMEGDKVDEVSVNAMEEMLPEENSLKDHGPYATNKDGSTDGWQQQASIQLSTVGKTPQEFTFNTSSKSGLGAIARLVDEFIRNAPQRLDETGEPMVPIVELDQTSFMMKDKKIGKIFAPKFEIVDWATTAELQSGEYGNDGDNPEDYAGEPEQAPAPTGKARPRRRQF